MHAQTAMPSRQASAAAVPASSSVAALPEEIFRATARGVTAQAFAWLSSGGSVNAGRRGDRRTLLHAAAHSGQIDVARELISRGAVVDVLDARSRSPLMTAAISGQPAVLLLLLRHGAHPDELCYEGETALMRAAQRGHAACATALLRANANPRLRSSDGYNAHGFASAAGHAAVARLISEHRSLGRGV
jgi:ankyrin repeat protein